MVDNGSILVAGAVGQLGAVGRIVTGLLLDRSLPFRPAARTTARRRCGRWRRGGVRRSTRTGRRLSGRQRLSARLLRHVRLRRVPGGDRNNGGGRPGTRGERPGQHVPADSLRDEHPEHHPEPSAAAALAQRAGARVVRPAGRHHPADNVPGELFPPRRSGRPGPRPHRTAVRAEQDLSGVLLQRRKTRLDIFQLDTPNPIKDALGRSEPNGRRRTRIDHRLEHNRGGRAPLLHSRQRLEVGSLKFGHAHPAPQRFRLDSDRSRGFLDARPVSSAAITSSFLRPVAAKRLAARFALGHIAPFGAVARPLLSSRPGTFS
jgi:hypothetical protein